MALTTPMTTLPARWRSEEIGGETAELQLSSGARGEDDRQERKTPSAHKRRFVRARGGSHADGLNACDLSCECEGEV